MRTNAEYVAKNPPAFEDVLEALHEARELARSALKSLEKADLAMGTDDYASILRDLRSASDEFRYAAEAADRVDAAVVDWDHSSEQP